MTKAEIVDSVYEKVGGFSKKEAAEVVEAVFDTMKDVLSSGEKIKISGFGNFVPRDKNERVGRNPQSGAPLNITARRVVTFKPSQVLKGVLNPHKAGDAEPTGAGDASASTPTGGGAVAGAGMPGSGASGTPSTGGFVPS